MALKPDILLVKKHDVKNFYFLSDLHIKNTTDQCYQNLLHFISQVNPQDLLIFGGDIFHVFVGGSNFFENKFKDFFLELQNLHTDWFYLCGNHDFHHQDIVHKYGGKYFDQPIILEITNKKIYIAH